MPKRTLQRGEWLQERVVACVQHASSAECPAFVQHTLQHDVTMHSSLAKEFDVHCGSCPHPNWRERGFSCKYQLLLALAQHQQAPAFCNEWYQILLLQDPSRTSDVQNCADSSMSCKQKILTTSPGRPTAFRACWESAGKRLLFWTL